MPHSSTTIDGNTVALRLAELVRIPSVTPMQQGPRAGVAGEAKIASFIADRFRALGGEVHLQEVFPGRPNVYGIWRGTSQRWIGVDVHTDTTGVQQMTDPPFDGRIDAGRVYGRGAVDTKATLAICLSLLESLRERRSASPDNLLIAATCDEEGSARGAPAMAEWLLEKKLVLDELAVAEPTGCVPVHGHKGVLRLTFEVEGKAAHSSKPHLGKNAIIAAAKLSLAFEAEHARLQSEGAQSPLGPASLTVTLFNGGVGMSVVPDRAELTIDRRVIIGERAADVAESYRALAARVCPLPVKMRTVIAIDAFHQAPDSSWPKQMAEWSGHAAELVPYCTNAWAYRDVARQCLVIGPGSIDQAHGAVEWVEISELERLANVFARWWKVA